jgi:hypothetical protein
MEIHKPKPVRSWRELLTEIGIIVLSVCIALAAEQAVEWVHWRNQVGEARAIIASEMATNVRQAIFRLRTERCSERRLDELAAILDTASRTGTLPPVGDIGTPPRGYWQGGAWESLVASQTATHFPREELASLSHVYKEVQKLEEVSSMEVTDWNALYAMVGPGRRLDPASEARLREVLSHARAIVREMALISGNLVRDVKSLNLPFSPWDLEVIARGRSQAPAKTRNEWSFLGEVCSPIEAVPNAYGQAMWKFIPLMADPVLKSIPDFSAGAR